MIDETYVGASRKKRGWAWLFPLTYLVHIAEEHWGGYSAYLWRVQGIVLTPTRFLILNGIGWLLFVAGILLAQRRGFIDWMSVCLGTIVLANGLSHTLSAIWMGAYNPGLLSGLLLFIPLGAATLLGLRRNMRWRRFVIAMLVGAAIQGAVFIIPLIGSRPTL